MATGSKLVLNFADSEGKSINLSYNYCTPDVAVAKVKALVTGIITNNVIFERAPITIKSSKVVTTTETDYDLNEE